MRICETSLKELKQTHQYVNLINFDIMYNTKNQEQKHWLDAKYNKKLQSQFKSLHDHFF